MGSYVSRTMVKSQPRYGVDMVVEMPRDMFQDKDYQNMRYFYQARDFFGVYHCRAEGEAGGRHEHGV